MACSSHSHTCIQSVLVISHSYSFKSDRNQNKNVLFNRKLKLICIQSNTRTLWVIKVLPAEPWTQPPFGVKSSSLAESAFGSREERLGSSLVSWFIMSSLIVEQCKSCWTSADLINIHTGSSLKMNSDVLSRFTSNISKVIDTVYLHILYPVGMTRGYTLHYY